MQTQRLEGLTNRTVHHPTTQTTPHSTTPRNRHIVAYIGVGSQQCTNTMFLVEEALAGGSAKKLVRRQMRQVWALKAQPCAIRSSGWSPP